MAAGQIGNPLIAQVGFGPGKAGLTTVAYTLLNVDGAIYRARTQDGVVELTNGDYYVILVFSQEWQGFILWDTGESVPRTAREPIEILPVPVVVAPQPVSPSLIGGTGTAGSGGTKATFAAILNRMGSPVRYHRQDSTTPCPCRTAEGFRDPEWHLKNPTAPKCDANGMLPDPSTMTDIIVKASIQPVAWVRTRISVELLQQMYGEIETDDHFGVFPTEWNGVQLNFQNWGRSGEDFIEYDGRRFYCSNSNLLPDTDGNPRHHWECALKLINDEALV